MAVTAKAKSSAQAEVRFTRVLPAPRALVFRMWTDPQHLARWWGPKGFTNPVCEVDVRPGGAIRIVMRAPDGADYPMSGTFHEIVEPERIVFTSVAEDKNGRPLLEGLNTVTFTEKDGQTTMTVHSSATALTDIGAGMLQGMEQGWGGSLERLTEAVAALGGCPGAAQPQAEHEWLHQFVGEWTYEGEAMMAPGQPPVKFNGTESVRSIGGLWVQGEGRGKTPDGRDATMLITLGYDPNKKRYVGTFVGSMMTYLFVYDGAVDAAGKVLTLDADGPNFADPTKVSAYQDEVEVVNKDHRILRSRVKDDSGNWVTFMTAHYRRKK